MEDDAEGSDGLNDIGSGVEESVSPLSAFASAQRSLVSIDFSAIQAAQKALQQSPGLAALVEAQQAIAANFAKSIDFAAVAEAHRKILGAGFWTTGGEAQKQWGESLAKSLDFPAITEMLKSSAALESFVFEGSAFRESLREQTELFARISETISSRIPKIDLSGLLSVLDRWIPGNLRDVQQLDVVADIALEEGLPLSWVPRTEIVVSLVGATGPEHRIAILSERRLDILDDCDDVLGSIEHEWATQCSEAVAAMRDGYDGPAQSHASNIIDSIVLGLHGRQGREHAKEQAQETFDDLPLQLAAENLSLRPRLRGLVSKWRNRAAGSLRPPRHSTCGWLLGSLLVDSGARCGDARDISHRPVFGGELGQLGRSFEWRRLTRFHPSGCRRCNSG
jgi:hypothetical protein